MRAKKSIFKRISSILLTIILIVLVAVVIFTVIARVSGNTPSVFGYMIFRVSSGSMEPELMVGDIILTKEVTDVETIEVGDVVTFHCTDGEMAGELVTHKVIEEPSYKNGKYYIHTKGVAAPEWNEGEIFSEDQLVSEMICVIPFIGMIYSFFLTPWGLIVAILLIILAFSGEFINIYKLSNEKPLEENVSEETLQKAIENYKSEKENIEEKTDTKED